VIGYCILRQEKEKSGLRQKALILSTSHVKFRKCPVPDGLQRITTFLTLRDINKIFNYRFQEVRKELN
jgi:hypothetical protein